MLLSSKHAREVLKIRSDFRGGLNSSVTADMIGDNQLTRVINLELDSATGSLQTVAGTKTFFAFPSESEIYSVVHDEINQVFLIIDTSRDVYVLNPETKALSASIGKLTGELKPVSVVWENGILLAASGQLQYYNGDELKTITGITKVVDDGDGNETEQFFPAPEVCNGVYIRSGRVVIYYDDILRYSAIGDEEDWSEDSYDPSTSKFLNVGYKEGGHIVAMINLVQDVIIVKSNGRIHRLLGEYPDWQVIPLATHIDCDNRLSCCALVNDVLILGKAVIQSLSTTQYYGDMRAADISVAVRKELEELSAYAKMVYLPPLNQVWILGAQKRVLVYDVKHNAFFLREFNSDVVDVFFAGNDVYVVKKDRINVLVKRTMWDDNKPLYWDFRAKIDVAVNSFLTKRVILDYIPYTIEAFESRFLVNGVLIEPPLPLSTQFIYHNAQRIFNNRNRIYHDPNMVVYSTGENIYRNLRPIYHNPDYIFSFDCQRKDVRCVVRGKDVDISGAGQGGSFTLNSLTLQIVVEV
jgi:hypothetical protein